MPVRPILRVGTCLVALSLLGCGGKTGLGQGTPPSEPRADATPERDSGPDAFMRPDTFVGPRDADVEPTVCPPATSIGFTIAPGGPIDLPGNGYARPSLGGDGAELMLAVENEPERTVILQAVDALGQPTGDSLGFSPATLPAIGAFRGEFVLAYHDLEGAVFVRAFDSQLNERWSIRVEEPEFVPEIARPVFNGRAWFVLVASRPTARLLGIMEGERIVDIRVEPIPTAIHLASDPETARTFLLTQYDRDVGINTIDDLGSPSVPVPLDDVGFDRVEAFAWGRGTRGLGPLVLAGSATSEDGRQRVQLRSFTEGGRGLLGFAAPITDTLQDADLTGRPPPGYDTGYGLVAAQAIGDWGVGFHGAASFVGDLQYVGPTGPLDRTVTIAPGPCGYVMMWDAGGIAEWDLRSALAVPRPPGP